MAEAISKITTNHEKIKKWAESHGGKPTRVSGTGNQNDPGILRFDFPGGTEGDGLQQISWNEWFDKFEEKDLALLYQEKKKSGEESTFFKLVNRKENPPND